MKSNKVGVDAFEAQFPHSEKYEHDVGYERPFSHEVPQHFARGGFTNPDYRRKGKSVVAKGMKLTLGS